MDAAWGQAGNSHRTAGLHFERDANNPAKLSGVAVVTQDIVTEKSIWEWLNEVHDPEIPVLSIIDLGIVREVRCGSQKGTTRITITPTRSEERRVGKEC